MPFTTLLFAYRKAGMTPAAFQDCIENTHMPLLKDHFGPLFPDFHTRRYLDRPADGGDASVLIGTQEFFDYDAVSELQWRDKEAFDAFFAKYQTPETAELLARDEAIFLDSARSKSVVLGGYYPDGAGLKLCGPPVECFY